MSFPCAFLASVEQGFVSHPAGNGASFGNAPYAAPQRATDPKRRAFAPDTGSPTAGGVSDSATPTEMLGTHMGRLHVKDESRGGGGAPTFTFMLLVWLWMWMWCARMLLRWLFQTS